MMWMIDHAEPITQDEYHFWMVHPLPFGWAILSAPMVVGGHEWKAQQRKQG